MYFLIKSMFNKAVKKIKYLHANRIFMFYPSGLIASYSHVVLRDTG